MKTKAFTLIEVLVSTVLLAIAMLAFMTGYSGYKRLEHTFDYRYTAVNIARELIEWAEAGRLPHPLGLVYMYGPGTNCTTDFNIPYVNDVNAFGWPDICGYTWQGSSAVDDAYGLKAWSHYNIGDPANTNPFDWIGDIETRGLVPTTAPHSVKIIFVARKWPLLQNINIYPPAYQTDVKIEWEEEGKQYTEYLGTIPVSGMNDQLSLSITNFSW